MEITNSIKLPKKVGKKQKIIHYTKFMYYINELLLMEGKYDNLFTPRNKSKSSRRLIVKPYEFDNIFQNNSFSFLDMICLLFNVGSSQNTGVFNFLLSENNTFSTKQKHKIEYINFDKLKEYKFSISNETIKKRQLFTLAFLSLVRDYFNTYNINIENKTINNKEVLNEYEELVINLFNDIFSGEISRFNSAKLIENFKRLKYAHLNLGIKHIENNLFMYMNNILAKITEINEQIETIKGQILNYYLYNHNQKETEHNWLKNFLNTCKTEIFDYQFEIEYSNNDITQQKLESKKLKQYNNFWINCVDDNCYALGEFINTQLGGNVEQFFCELGYMHICYQKYRIITPFCDNENNPLEPNFVFNELQKIEKNNFNYLSKFNDGINFFYQQQITEIQNQYNTLIQTTSQNNQINIQIQQRQFEQYNQNNNINTIQQNQQTLQNLDNALYAINNEQEFVQHFNNQ